MAQKIIKIGSSVGVTLSKDILEATHLQVGDTVEVTKDPESAGILIAATKQQKPSVNPELVEWIDSAIERYRPALEALADK